jgi:hypothetical protein
MPPVCVWQHGMISKENVRPPLLEIFLIRKPTSLYILDKFDIPLPNNRRF